MMNLEKALEILKILADGIDPFTGEVFPSDSPYQNVDMVRALRISIDAMELAAKRLKRKKNLPERAGKAWDKTESDLLVQRFNGGSSIDDLAKEHKRTKGAILSQLAKLGKIELYKKLD